jgi:hypothetical protein
VAQNSFCLSKSNTITFALPTNKPLFTTASTVHIKMIIPHDAVSPSKCSVQRKLREDSDSLSTLPLTLQKPAMEVEQYGVSSSASACRKKGITFAEYDNKYYTNTKMCQDGIQSLWYSPKQIKKFRNKAKAKAGEIASLEKCDKKKKKKKKSTSSSYTGLLAKTFQNCCQCNSETDESVLTLSERKKLTKRMRGSPKRLGLERLVFPMNRFETRKQLLEAIISIQNSKPVFTDKTNNNNRPAGQGQHRQLMVCSSAEQIRQVCESLSRPYRLFSRHLAQALVPKKKPR